MNRGKIKIGIKPPKSLRLGALHGLVLRAGLVWGAAPCWGWGIPHSELSPGSHHTHAFNRIFPPQPLAN